MCDLSPHPVTLSPIDPSWTNTQKACVASRQAEYLLEYVEVVQNEGLTCQEKLQRLNDAQEEMESGITQCLASSS